MACAEDDFKNRRLSCSLFGNRLAGTGIEEGKSFWKFFRFRIKGKLLDEISQNGIEKKLFGISGRISFLDARSMMKMKILYYDCFSGISGDMNLGALIDLGADKKRLLSELKKLNLGAVSLQFKKAKRKNITGIQLEIRDDSKKGKGKRFRSYREIVRLIEQSPLKTGVKETSLKIFAVLARAEAKIHGCKMKDVHFHEIGSLDSIVDVVGAAVCLDDLKVDKIFSSPLEVGRGQVECRHGILPVPAPATAEILKGIPIKFGGVPVEVTTPTGAAILAATASEFTETMEFRILKVGYGIGQRDNPLPNVLRVYLGEIDQKATSRSEQERRAYLIECNIDDMNPELYEVVMDVLFEKGAQDVFLTPIIMKRSRPAVMLSVLCDAEKKDDLCNVLFRETTTFGLRVTEVTKKMLLRDIVKRKTKYGNVAVKRGYLQGEIIKSKPEFEACRLLAKKKGVPVRRVIEGIPGEKS